jgi:hypothetical protein
VNGTVFSFSQTIAQLDYAFAHADNFARQNSPYVNGKKIKDLYKIVRREANCNSRLCKTLPEPHN